MEITDLRLYQLIDQIQQTAAGANGLLVPVSGGSDSALNFWLCAQAFPERTLAVHAGENLRCHEWFNSVGKLVLINTPGRYTEREEIRWGRFMAMSLNKSAWLVGSRNRTEDMLGTYSLASRLATYLPLVNVWKSEVMELCQAIGVPKEIIASSLRADPDCGRPPELAEIPFAKIEAVLRSQISGDQSEALATVSPQEASYLETLINRNAFKKTLPIRGLGL